MTRARTRLFAVVATIGLTLTGAVVAAPAALAADEVNLQLLSFNDFHGHLEAGDEDPLTTEQDPTQSPVGGVEYLASTLTRLRAQARNSLTVAAGDLIGASPFLSGLFHDEPSIEALNKLGLDVSSVGNHEFDEGTKELLRIRYGGCHPTDGCYFPNKPYAGTQFPYLAANVIKKGTNQSLLPGTAVKVVNGVKVGFIGMTLKGTPTLVSPAGVATVDFKDEVTTANAQARVLQSQGVQSIVVLIHEGGEQAGRFDGCVGISGPIVTIAKRLAPSIDAVVSGHTHQPYVCSINDPAGKPRMVTSASSYGRVVTNTTLVLNRSSGDVVRDKVTSTNVLVTHGSKDPAQTSIIAKWDALATPRASRVVGTIAGDISGDASGDRGASTPMANLVADAILAGAGPGKGNAQIAFMNTGGVRASLKFSQITNGERPGEVTYAEAYAVNPFGNMVVSMNLTGAQIKQLLEEQYQVTADRGSRSLLALGVSNGFTYTWDGAKPQGAKVVPGSMKLNGVTLDPARTYRVATVNFLSEGGDGFTTFTKGTGVLGGPEDLQNFVAYLQAHPNLAAPGKRVDGL